MENSFEIGDRVEVLSDPRFCKCDDGKIGLVAEIERDMPDANIQCGDCGHVASGFTHSAHVVPQIFIGWQPLYRLRKLPPLAEPETSARAVNPPVTA